MLLSLIVPCYNEKDALPLFYREATNVLAGMDCDYEILLINDGSRDNTLEIMKELAASDPHIFYYSFSRNFGKESAMYAGFCNARGDYVAVMDADLQDPPSLLPEMVKILESGEYDSVATRRADRAGEPPVRSWFARRFYSLINQISDADIVDGARDFRLMTKGIASCQREDGFWNPSLVSTNYAMPETSGTALFLYGLCWGMNNGYLKAADYRQMADRAWQALVTVVHPNGFLGWMQGTGKDPSAGQPLSYDRIPDFEDYGTGCFLLGATEYYKLLSKIK